MAAQHWLDLLRLDLVCRTTIIVFSILYLLALIAFLTGTFGWLGQERDPLSGVFLLPLGLPWIILVDLVSESAKPWFAAIVPVLNLLALVLICRWVRSLRQK
ncbi:MULTISPECIES: hypothetical protein [unclassified Ruegeria]|uniref:hypothetical protein n=1 Tax=unclassified Ruegeria TaxID=2625375 RepID=UPI0014923529|nr:MULTISPECIES: hypothetical protein [unclassified Ruegeria]NOC45570.1 hypothetical protein [Ruegeria sp. HKCCD7559]NOD86516.1 hypothetical protein [Ruegeria sp. HKCCD6119]